MLKTLFLPLSKRRWLAFLGVAAVPSIVCFIIIASQANFLSFSPVWSDEIFNWHEMLTFKTAGFNGGYYTMYERSAAAAFTHFYTYGPWFPMIYGTVAYFTGWERITFVIFNMVFVTAAFVTFCRVAELRGRQLFLLALALGSFWCLITFLPTAMQEAFQQALAILIAAILFLALKYRHEMNWKWFITGWLILALAALMRVSWGILFFPFAWLTAKPKTTRRTGAVLFAAVLLAVLYWQGQYTGSPGNNSIIAVIDKFSVSFNEGWSALQVYFNQNLERFLNYRKHPMDILQTVQVIILWCGAVVAALIQIFRKRSPYESFFHFYNITAIVAASCALYLVGTWGDYRVIGTHLMVSLLLLIGFKRFKPVQFFIVTNLVFMPAFYIFFQSEVVYKYQVNPQPIQDLNQNMEAAIPFNPQAPSSWCNTVLFPVNSFSNKFSPLLSAVPAGFGLTFFWDPTAPVLSYRSQYLLLDKDSYERISQRSDAPHLEEMLTTNLGNLYRNLDADCSSQASGRDQPP